MISAKHICADPHIRRSDTKGRQDLMEAKELLYEIPKGLLGWYDFKNGGSALYIGDPTDSIAELLEERGLQVVCVSLEQSKVIKPDVLYDHIVSIREPEKSERPEEALAAWRALLKPDGRLLLGVNNRLGVRYFCGDRDPYTDRNFDGVEGYRRAYAKKEDRFNGRCYSRAEWKEMLERSGWGRNFFYSVLSDLDDPSIIYAEDFVSNEDVATRVGYPTYHYPDTVFLEEEGLYKTLWDNGMFHTMANAYLIECSPSGSFSDVDQVTCSMDRGREYARLTILHKSGVVEKRAAYPEGRKHLENLLTHEAELSARGIKVISGKIEKGSYITPYIHAEVGQVYLKRLLLTDKERFIQELDRFMELIISSSEIVSPDRGDGEGAILRRGYLDMVPLNSFYMDGGFVFFDQEFSVENYPANAVMNRVIATLYAGNAELAKALPIDALYERYHLKAQAERWRAMEWEFLGPLLNTKVLRNYHAACRRDPAVVHSNRLKINYSAEAYDRLFVDIFRNADTRKLILFGAGAFAKKFLALYSQDYPVCAIVDNKESDRGQTLEGVEIHSPELLRQLQPGEYKVIVCIKNYLSVMKQLDEMGVGEYSIYDAGKDYPRKRKPILAAPAEPAAPSERKRFHIGYVPGVFDLFHIGHLNLLKRAKEQCDYLIVGVVTDEWVKKNKPSETVIPFEERIELIRSCRYVDEAVEIPAEFSGIQDAYKLHHFDCQFTGSDHADDPDWLAEKEFLRKHGAELVFFPYTESTSSTKLKELIEEKLQQ